MKYSNVNDHPRKKKFLQLSGGLDPKTLEELFQAIKTVMSNDGTNLTGFAFSLRYGSVGTSHSQPLLFDRTAYQTNYPELPGFTGRVWSRYGSPTKDTWGSSPFAPTLTHTGTGGFGSYEGPWLGISRTRYNLLRMVKGTNKETLKLDCGSVPDDYLRIYSYDYRIFLSDFPGLQKTVSEMDVMQRLGGEEIPYMAEQYFEWTNPDTKLFDDEIMAEYHRKLTTEVT